MSADEVGFKVYKHVRGQHFIELWPAGNLQKRQIQRPGLGEYFVVGPCGLQQFVHPPAHGDVAVAENIYLSLYQGDGLTGFVGQSQF